MDIAKIRKKAKQKENGAEETPRHLPEQETPQEPQAAETEQTAPAGESPQLPSDAVTAEAAPAEETPPAGTGDAGGGDEHAEELVELLTFRLGQEEFAFRVSEIEEIIRHQQTTYVPTAPGYVLGITSLRGKIIPVLDLKKRLSLDRVSYVPPSHNSTVRETGCAEDGSDSPEEGERHFDQQKILIVTGSRGVIGATIDKVLGVVRLPSSEILNPPAHLSDEEIRYIAGVVILEKRFISLLRADVTMDMDFK